MVYLQQGGLWVNNVKDAEPRDEGFTRDSATFFPGDRVSHLSWFYLKGVGDPAGDQREKPGFTCRAFLVLRFINQI